LAIAAPKINLRKLWWNIASGLDHTRIFFDGSDTEQTVAYLRGGTNGLLNYTEVLGGAIGMGAAAGNASNVLGDVSVTTVGGAAADTYLIGIEIGKMEGFELPNFQKNGQLGYNHNRSGFGDSY
jgi:hypothetical protein